jgi:hypothetical protein
MCFDVSKNARMKLKFHIDTKPNIDKSIIILTALFWFNDKLNAYFLQYKGNLIYFLLYYLYHPKFLKIILLVLYDANVKNSKILKILFQV